VKLDIKREDILAVYEAGPEALIKVEAGKALDICLDDIKRPRPFFIGFLGERYGSIFEKVSERCKIRSSMAERS
jgi:hypothetical protein